MVPLGSGISVPHKGTPRVLRYLLNVTWIRHQLSTQLMTRYADLAMRLTSESFVAFSEPYRLRSNVGTDRSWRLDTF